MEALYRRKSAASPICPICHTHEESIEHLFLLWVETFGLVIRANDKSKPDLERVLSLIAFSCWHIWKARCCFLFQQKHINPLQVLSAISTSVGVFLEATESPSMSAVQHRHGGAGQESISCMLANISDGRWEAFPVLVRCLRLREAFQDCHWSWKPISANMAANILHK
ncbi:hypothetical protein ACFXTO_038550 [Malus domestica]